MNKYGQTSVNAVQLIQDGKTTNPLDAWNKAVRDIYPNNKPSQDKACPKSAFLGLCEEGKIKNVSRGSYTRSKLNKNYALKALSLIETGFNIEMGAEELWIRVMNGVNKKSNAQMDVVISLYEAGYTNVK